MKTLLLETSSEFALLAVLEKGQILLEVRLSGGPELSKMLGAEIKKILAPPYDRIVVGIGPGSFTGTRVGASMASALAFGWKIPLYTASSLTAFGPKTVAIDARMGGIYVQRGTESPLLLPLLEAAEFLSKELAIASPHPDKILARIPGLTLEKQEPNPLLLAQHAEPAKFPLQLHYMN